MPQSFNSMMNAAFRGGRRR